MNQNDLELIGRDWFRILESSRKPPELEFSALPTELSEIWKIFLRYETNTWTLASEPAEDWTHRGMNPDHLNSSSVWDQHLDACFRASRGFNPPRFEPGPSELEFSALPTELSHVNILYTTLEKTFLWQRDKRADRTPIFFLIPKNIFFYLWTIFEKTDEA
jgi:hypothetical protein